MRVTSQTLSVPLLARKTTLALYADLLKARLTMLVVVTTAAGFYLGSSDPLDLVRLCHTLLGTFLLAGGAGALNQWMEREYDARMRRTQDRPLPSQRLKPKTALRIGLLSCGTGTLVLLVNASLWASVVGGATALLYLGVYTPLKRRTWLNTLIGAVPGALPPLIGWAAARQELSREAWILFTLQFCWQIPHFLSIAWIYREDYAGAGFVMLPCVDPSGRRTGALVVDCSIASLLASLLPVVAGWVGPGYLPGAILCGGAFVACALRFSRYQSASTARQLFLASILYLPFVLGLLAWFKRML
jgi:heme o synthase